MTAEKLPLQEFLDTFKKAPRAALSLVVKTEKGLLLARRDVDPCRGVWDVPGSFILRGETFDEVVRRVARDELGVGVRSHKVFGVYENLGGDPRGHVIDLIFSCELDGEPRPTKMSGEISYFRERPDVFPGHERIVEEALG